jgi:hypothetical protein
VSSPPACPLARQPALQPDGKFTSLQAEDAGYMHVEAMEKTCNVVADCNLTWAEYLKVLWEFVRYLGQCQRPGRAEDLKWTTHWFTHHTTIQHHKYTRIEGRKELLIVYMAEARQLHVAHVVVHSRTKNIRAVNIKLLVHVEKECTLRTQHQLISKARYAGHRC